MGVLTFLGKVLIISSILLQAYLLYQNESTGAAFDTQLSQALTACHCLSPEIQQHVKAYLRLVIAGLLASSVLILVCKCWSFKLPTFIGLALLLWVEHRSSFCTVPTLAILENTALWHSLGVIGAIIYLAGAECSSCKTNCGPEPSEIKSKKADEKKKN